PLANALTQKLPQELTFLPQTRPQTLQQSLKHLNQSHLLLLQNTPFQHLHPKKESKNHPQLPKYSPSLPHVFLNHPFPTPHRHHPSNLPIPSNLQTLPRFLMQKEIKYIRAVVQNPHKPLLPIL
ncbi:phosphoglycerate kinase, partial [Staphylococcus saprophyticus]|uniref:phosphoglycerate kinase n=1 Tax=Staphylococcus saprophyticus TaxID=29385 RepID=UPI001244280C